MINKDNKGISKMKKTVYIFLLVIASIVLTSCGGGGGGAAGPTNPVRNDALKFTFFPVQTSIPANTLGYPHFLGSPFLTQYDVRVTFNNGQVIPDGTSVNLTTSNSTVAYIGIPDDGATTEDEFAGVFASVPNETVGGRAVFFVHGLSPGSVTLTASATNPQDSRSYSATSTYTINPGPTPLDQLNIESPRSTLPRNSQNVDYFEGTPFVIEADITMRDIFGNLTNPADSGSGAVANVSVSPSNVLLFSRFDDLSTDNVNEFLSPVSQGVVPMVSGHGSLFLWAQDVAGTATVTVSLIEAGTGFEFNKSFNITVVGDGDAGIPTDILVSNGGALYVNGSGGNTSQSVAVTVKAGNIPVNDPSVNNVRLSMTTDGPNSGEKLVGTNYNGNTVQGSSINISTVNGVVNASVQSGTEANTITVTATTDKADNNVDNGLQDPLSTTTNFIVSDGVLWALELSSSALDVLTVNGDTTIDTQSGELTYNFQDGTYTLVMGVIGTDKGGNPALAQTVQFGLVNSPISGFPTNGSGFFVISSNDGNPQEGGSTFTSATANFLTDAGGVQPGDTLLVFGEESLGNEDLESAVTVATVNSQTSLTIVEKFNRNDSTGVINNDFGILPYLVGRSVDGNINATAVLNENGVGTTTINYPVSQLGRIASVYVKGQGPIENNIVKSITDVELMAYPGVEGFNDQSSTLTVSPSVIPGNTSVAITVCLADSARNPLQGRFIEFSYLGDGSGSIDGQSTAGLMGSATGTNGCTVGIATTSGILPSDGATGGFNFTSGGLTCNLDDSGQEYCVDVLAPANGVLNANPSSFLGRGSLVITLTLYDGAGNPIEGAAIQGSCEQVSGGNLGIINGPTVTNSNGQSFATVVVALDSPDGGEDGTCTFATASGEPTVDVNFSGEDSCRLLNPSPTPDIGDCDVVEQYRVGGFVNGLTSPGPLVLQNNGANNITLTSDNSFTFPLQDEGELYFVTVLTQPPGQTCTVTNGSGTISTSDVNDVDVTCTTP
jgi:hypothetical protein